MVEVIATDEFADWYRQFIRSYWETFHACDFFAVETLGMFGTVRYMVFFVIEFARALCTSPECESIRTVPG